MVQGNCEILSLRNNCIFYVNTRKIDFPCSDQADSKLNIGVRAYKSPPKEDYRNLSETFWAAYRASKAIGNSRAENRSEEKDEKVSTMTAFSTTTIAPPPSPENTMKQVDGKSTHEYLSKQYCHEISIRV